MKLLAVFALAAVLAPAAVAQHQTFVVNPDASDVKITLNTTHEVVNGAFHIRSGSIEFDRSNAKLSGSVVGVAGSGKTCNDSHDKNPSFLIWKADNDVAIDLSLAGPISK